MSRMEKRVTGFICIRCIMSLWNAGFDKYPKQNADGEYYGTDFALKYSFRRYWDLNGLPVLIYKKLKERDGKLIPMSLAEKCKSMLDRLDGEDKDIQIKDIIKLSFRCIDTKNFGVALLIPGNDMKEVFGISKKDVKANKGKKRNEKENDGEEDGKSEGVTINQSITGVVQIFDSLNIYKEAKPAQCETILSPFLVNEEKEASTLGTRVFLSEAHYAYPFVVNPLMYKNYEELGYTEGYTEKDYESFKEAARFSATSLDSTSKSGCENELAIFVETDENLILPNLTQFISFKKDTNKNIYNIGFGDMLNSLGDRIHSVEIYYNTFDIEIKHNIKKCRMFDITTKKEVK